MKIARIYLRVSTDEQDLTRQADIEQSTRCADSLSSACMMAGRPVKPVGMARLTKRLHLTAGDDGFPGLQALSSPRST